MTVIKKVFQIMDEHEGEIRPRDVHAILEQAGIDASISTVRVYACQWRQISGKKVTEPDSKKLRHANQAMKGHDLTLAKMEAINEFVSAANFRTKGSRLDSLADLADKLKVYELAELARSVRSLVVRKRAA